MSKQHYKITSQGDFYTHDYYGTLLGCKQYASKYYNSDCYFIMRTSTLPDTGTRISTDKISVKINDQ